MRGLKRFSGLTALLISFSAPIVYAALPATTNYQLNSFGFGNGGTSNSTTSNYGLEGITGEISGSPASTSNYALKPGFVQTQQANVPKVTISNPSSYYDKLKFVIDAQGNPSDALYALQIKAGDPTCDFTTGTINYIKQDLTVGSTLTLNDYRLYSFWGGASGSNIIGLAPSTTYCLRAKATQGKYTESAYGPSTNSATVGQSITFCLYTNADCNHGGTAVAFGGILPNTVTNSPNNIGLNFATNADNGGSIYMYGRNGALKSTSKNYPITSQTSANLSADSQGFGAQLASASSLTKVSPYNGSGNSVGIISTTVNTLLTSTVPVTSGSAAVQLQVKPSNAAPASTDYTENLTLVAAAAF